jgi:hypothetical protein
MEIYTGKYLFIPVPPVADVSVVVAAAAAAIAMEGVTASAMRRWSNGRAGLILDKMMLVWEIIGAPAQAPQ